MEEFIPMRNQDAGSRCSSLLYASPVLGTPNGNSAGYGGRGNSCRDGSKDHRNGRGAESSSHELGSLGIAGAFQIQPEAVDAQFSVKREAQHQAEKFRYSLVRDPTGWQGPGEGSGDDAEAIKAKIIAHPQYPDLLQAYMDCQKIGAPPEVAEKLSAMRREFESRKHPSETPMAEASSKDPELDQFMEAYYDMLVKYREEVTRPLQEAMEFMRRIEAQLNSMSGNGSCPLGIFPSAAEDKCEGVGSSEDELQENSGGETDQLPEIDPRAEDRELKNHLLRKYSGYLSSLKQELSKKKKKGKLPKEARQKLLSWWELHYKWPYPSETEKVALAEATGLDQKQINNWFINQRKRHWKPSEDMQFMVMDGLHPQGSAALYMDGHYICDGPYRLGP
ncbi:hypothetical protein MLD38_001727 [Melastoma candidum]|uniref:Uncharacterized protein n=1 Tax=Melastoma candidum TaxID=119954 RepID=A0ACB9SFG0_9MYRT|nr:hypothetical protein MLD38_001727 [Melastoma candidum]